MRLDNIAEKATKVVVTNEKTTETLKHLGFEWPKITYLMLSDLIDKSSA